MFKTKYDTTNIETGGRRLRVIRAIFAEGGTPEQDRDEMIAYVFRQMWENQDLDAVLMFGYSSKNQEAHGSFDRGRAVMTKEGRGWLGNGQIIGGAGQDRLGVLWYQRDIISPMVGAEYPLMPNQPSPRDLWDRVADHLAGRSSPVPSIQTDWHQDHLFTEFLPSADPVDPTPSKPRPFDPNLPDADIEPPPGRMYIERSPIVCIRCHRRMNDHHPHCLLGSSPRVANSDDRHCTICLMPIWNHKFWCRLDVKD